MKNYGQMFIILYSWQRTKPSKEKEIQEAKLLPEKATNSLGKKRSEKQGRKGKMHSTKCKISETSKKKLEAFFNKQWKEIEERNTRGKIRDLFKKTGNIKGIFHPKMDTINDRNGRNLIEAEEIEKRWQEYTEELYRKDHNDLDNHDGVGTHSQSDILECEVKWALGSTATNKANGGEGIPTELFKILKDDAIKVLH